MSKISSQYINNINWRINPKLLSDIANKIVERSTDAVSNIKANKFVSVMADIATEYRIFNNVCIILKNLNNTNNTHYDNAINILNKGTTYIKTNPNTIKYINIKNQSNMDNLFNTVLIYKFGYGTNTNKQATNYSDILDNITQLENDLMEYYSKKLELIQTIKNIEDESKRKSVLKSCNKYKSNIDKLNKLLNYRHMYACSLGYTSYGSMLDIQRIHNTDMTKAIFNRLLKLTENDYAKEIKTIANLKLNHINNDSVYMHDIEYYITFQQLQYGLDNNLIKEYFPISYVLPKILWIINKLFDVEINKTTIKSWNDEVEVYELSENKIIIGYIYLDLYFRHGKNNTVEYYEIQPASIYNKSIQYPISCISANFSKTELLVHSNLILLMKKFGKTIHNMYSRSRYSILNSSYKDYEELPEYIFEHLCWKKEILKMLSKHHVSKEELPDDIIKKMLAIKDTGRAILLRIELYHSMFDQLIHCDDYYHAIDKSDDKSTFILNASCVLREHVLPNIKSNSYTIDWINISERGGWRYTSMLNDLYARELVATNAEIKPFFKITWMENPIDLLQETTLFKPVGQYSLSKQISSKYKYDDIFIKKK